MGPTQRRWLWSSLRCAAPRDRSSRRLEDFDSLTADRLSKGRARPGRVGRRGVEGESLLRRRFRVPIKTRGSFEDFDFRWDRPRLDDEMARRRSIHLSADSRRRDPFDDRAIGRFDGRFGLVAGCAQTREDADESMLSRLFLLAITRGLR